MTEIGRPQPYIGVSGIGSVEQHVALLDIAARESINKLGHFMMIGVQATTKTQVLDVENRRGQAWHPVGDTILGAAASDDSGLTKPFVHCAFIKDADLEQGVTNVMRRTRHYVRGLQFNGLPWISRDYQGVFSNFKESYEGQEIILQASGRLLRDHPPRVLADVLGRLPVDYILLDPSGGMGKELDTRQMRNYVDEIYQRRLPIGVGIAGGLDAENVERLFGPFVEEYPDLSCDAEGKLRQGPEGATTLNLGAVDAFIVAWKKVITNLTPEY